MPKPDRKPEPEPVRKLEAEPSKTLSSPKEKPHRATRQEKRAKKRLRRQEREDEGLLHSADALIAAFAIPVIIMLIIFVQRGNFPIWRGNLPAHRYVSSVCAVLFGVPV